MGGVRGGVAGRVEDDAKRAMAGVRRSLLQRVGATAAVAALSGCGFRLRSNTPLAFERLSLQGVLPSSPLGQEIRRQLGNRVQWMPAAGAAQVVLTVESAQREKFVTGLTSSGLVRELLLRLRVRYRLTTGTGRLLLNSTDAMLQRDMTTNETVALAKAREEEELYRVLERDVVMQIVRRLEALTPERLAQVD